MTRVIPRYRERVRAGEAFVEWINTSGGWLRLKPPGATAPIQIAPGRPMQVRVADLRAYPWLDAFFEGAELAGLLTRVRG